MSDGSGGLLARFGLPPQEIEARSLAIVEAALDGAAVRNSGERFVLTRMAYAAGDLDLARLVRFHPEAVPAGVRALQGGATLVTDVRMALAALDRDRCSRLRCPTSCAIDGPSVAEAARRRGVARAAVAIEVAAAHLEGGIAVIGNAPTALLALLDLVDAGAVRPALIIGTPVGFVAAQESKEELCARSVPYITVLGTRGGSAVAAAAANALLRLALGEGACP